MMVVPGAGAGRSSRVKPLSFLLAAALLAEPPVAAPSPCPGAAAERTALQAERATLNRTIGDIALGKSRRKRKVSGGEVAAGVAGTAASVLLPFGIGALLSAGAGAAAKASRKKRPAPAPPDVPAMIERLRSIDARLKALEGCGGE
jgi:hypothetical protein